MAPLGNLLLCILNFATDLKKKKQWGQGQRSHFLKLQFSFSISLQNLASRFHYLVCWKSQSWGIWCNFLQFIKILTILNWKYTHVNLRRKQQLEPLSTLCTGGHSAFWYPPSKHPCFSLPAAQESCRCTLGSVGEDGTLVSIVGTYRSWNYPENSFVPSKAQNTH